MRVRLAFLFLIVAFLCVQGKALPARDANSARAFVESLYKLYGKGGRGVPSQGPAAQRYYHSSLLALMRADEKAVGPGDVGVLDGDPVCGCQDWDGIWDLHIEIQMKSAERAIANVSFALEAPASGMKLDVRRLVITLVTEKNEWGIWDVRDESDAKNVFDVRAALEREIRGLAKQPKATSKR
jgi:hypothetical protein